jgi:hypothetical protein
MIVGFVMLLLVSVQLEASDGLEVSPDKTTTYNKDGLLIVVSLVDDPQKALAEWGNPSFNYVPVIKTRAIFHRGEIVFPAITFATDAMDREGKAKITFDLLILKPDGSVYINDKNLTVVDGVPPRGIGLVKDKNALKIENHDPFGKYKIQISVHDQIKKVTVDIPMEFTVAP